MNKKLRLLVGLLVSGLILYALSSGIADTDAWQAEGSGADNLDDLVVGLFETHVIGLEVLGILLTAAMIGALVIARPLGVSEDLDNYHHDPRLDEALTANAEAAVGAGASAALIADGGEEE